MRRRYPAPWKVEEYDEAYAVVDAGGQKLAFVYYEDEPQRRMTLQRMSKDDAWQLARAITRIPMLLRKD